MLDRAPETGYSSRSCCGFEEALNIQLTTINGQKWAQLPYGLQYCARQPKTLASRVACLVLV